MTDVNTLNVPLKIHSLYDLPFKAQQEISLISISVELLIRELHLVTKAHKDKYFVTYLT